MSLDNKIQASSEHSPSLTNYPSLDPNEPIEKAKEFEQKFKTQKRSEALLYFNDLPAHCKEYIMKTEPYRMYWRASRIAC